MALAQDWDDVFDRASAEYGVPRGILLAFWAFETDFGAVQGDFDTRNALVTLAQDCRRPELFQPQVFAAIALISKGIFEPGRSKGAWGNGGGPHGGVREISLPGIRERHDRCVDVGGGRERLEAIGQI